jgi:hypothetical protein
MDFPDYHRTVVGYHGTTGSVADSIVLHQSTFQSSQNDDDWLGSGIYFWEYAPRQAERWAIQRYAKSRKPVAVLASMIRLGHCFDLLDPLNVGIVAEIHENYLSDLKKAGRSPPQYRNASKRLDCQVFNYAVQYFLRVFRVRLDTIRAVYVPRGKDRRIWKRSWIMNEAHIQLCVLNPKNILGTWKVVGTTAVDTSHETNQ